MEKIGYFKIIFILFIGEGIAQFYDDLYDDISSVISYYRTSKLVKQEKWDMNNVYYINKYNEKIRVNGIIYRVTGLEKTLMRPEVSIENYNFLEIIFSVSCNVTVWSIFLNNFSEIKRLYMNYLDLEMIVPGTFIGLHELRLLELKGNELTQITDGIFNNLYKLTVVHLSSNEIENITTHAFRGLKNLEEIALDMNNLSTIDENLFETQRMTLKVLNLENNHLQDVDFIIKGMNLRTLNLGYNKLERFLYVETENITLDNNNIENVTDGDFHQFKHVDLSRNNINHILDIRSMKLIFLDLSFNNISLNEGTELGQLEKLTELHLQFNNITEIAISCFARMSSLEYLDLSDNKISVLQYGLFTSLSNLIHLDVSSNKLKNIDVGIFHPLRYLKEIYLKLNYISHLDPDQLLKILPQLRKVDLNDNPWICEDLVNIVHILSTRLIVENGYTFDKENIRGIKCTTKNRDTKISVANETAPIDDVINKNLDKKISEINDLFNSDFKKSSFFDYFNNRFTESKFYKFLENLKYPKFIVSNNSSSNVTRFEKLVDSEDTMPKLQNYNAFLTIIILILFFILAMLIFIVYLNILPSKQNIVNNLSRVQEDLL